MTSQQQHVLFVGSYASADEPGIYCFNFDSTSGGLSVRSEFSGIDRPSFVVLHPNGRFLYAVSEVGLGGDGRYGSVHALSLEPNSMTMHHLNEQSTQGDWPCHLQIDGTGEWLAAANYGTGDVAIYPILADGSLGEMSSFVQHEGAGPNEARQEGPHAHSTTFTPDNRFAIVADLGIDQLVIYKFDAENGQLTPHGHAQTRPGAGPRHLAFHPDGLYVSVANELDNTVSTYAYNSDKGNLIEQQTLDTVPTDVSENSVADIHITPSGKYLIISNRGHDSLAHYGIGADGQLTLLTIDSCGGHWPRNFALSPDGRFALVANERSDDISVFPLLSEEAKVGKRVTHFVVRQPSCIQFG